MPLYEYECKKCGNRFEALQRFSDDPLKTHDGCGGPVERLLSAPAFQFKGSGWYVTDYGRGNGNGKKSTETKTDTPKPEVKPAASESAAKK